MIAYFTLFSPFFYHLFPIFVLFESLGGGARVWWGTVAPFVPLRNTPMGGSCHQVLDNINKKHYIRIQMCR